MASALSRGPDGSSLQVSVVTGAELDGALRRALDEAEDGPRFFVDAEREAWRLLLVHGRPQRVYLRELDPPDEGAGVAARVEELVQLVASLRDALREGGELGWEAARARVELAERGLGGAPGPGLVLQLGWAAAALDASTWRHGPALRVGLEPPRLPTFVVALEVEGTRAQRSGGGVALTLWGVATRARLEATARFERLHVGAAAAVGVQLSHPTVAVDPGLLGVDAGWVAELVVRATGVVGWRPTPVIALDVELGLEVSADAPSYVLGEREGTLALLDTRPVRPIGVVWLTVRPGGR